MHQELLQFFSNLADFIGIVAFAFSGLLSARARSLDPVGVFVLAFTTAFGGGIIRDLLINNRVLWFIAHEYYVWVVIVLTVFAPMIVDRFYKDLPYSVFIWADAVGLGFFAASGSALAWSFGTPMLSSTLLGVVTGAAGGMLRDVFMNRLPLVLSDRQPYAIIAFAGSWLTLGLIWAGCNPVLAVWIGALFILGLRMYAWYRKIEIAYNKSLLVISRAAEVKSEITKRIADRARRSRKGRGGDGA